VCDDQSPTQVLHIPLARVKAGDGFQLGTAREHSNSHPKKDGQHNHPNSMEDQGQGGKDDVIVRDAPAPAKQPQARHGCDSAGSYAAADRQPCPHN
jgi:hypothetical protein